MKYKKNIGFAIIYRNKPILNSLVNVFTKAYKINKRFFGKDVKSFRIFVCDNESDFKKQMKYYYKKRTTASVMRNNDLITRSPEFIGKVGRWDKKLFPKIMVHEINHVFWNSFYRTCKPCWLLEGLACYVAGFRKLSKKQLKNLVNKYKIDYSILDYRYLKRKFKISPQIVKYPIWFSFTTYLVDKYSGHKLVRLMDLYNRKHTRQNYDKVFKKVFSVGERDLFGEFVLYIKK